MSRFIDGLRFRIRALFAGRAIAHEMAREMDFHVAMETERLVRDGVPLAEAQRQAWIAFGGRQRFREETRDAIGGRGLADAAELLRQAARTLIKHRGFTTVAVLSLALAIALNTTMYSVLDALINPRIEMRQPEQIYNIGYFGNRRQTLDKATVNAVLRSGGRTYSALTFGSRMDHLQALIDNGAVNHRGDVETVAPNYFAFLGVRAAEGRLFTADDMQSSERPIVLSERLRRHLFATDKTSLGKRITVDGDSYVVIGVLNRAADFPGSQVSGWVLPPPGAALESQMFNLIRLRPGVTQPQAEAELSTLSGRIAATVGERASDDAFHMGSVLQQRQLHLNNFHFAVIGSVIAVLLVACANLANLQLARGIARSRELATRAALGASRADLVRHLLLESGLLGLAGLVLGLVLTFWGMHVLAASIPDTIGDFIVEPQTSWRMFAFALGAAIVCLLLIGLLPAIRVSRVDLNDLIKSGNGTGSLRRGRRQYGMLLVAEIGFALLLACGASLLVRSARQIAADHAGYDTAPLVTGWIRAKVPDKTAWSFTAVAAEFSSRVRNLRDVADDALSMGVSDVDNEVTATDPAGALRVAPATIWSYTVVSPSYFRTYGVGMLHGRDFLDGEQGPVAIVSPETARALWPDSPAVGQMIKFGSPGTPGMWYTVVGVHARMATPGGPMDTPPPPTSAKQRTKSGAHYLIAGRERSVYLAASSPGAVYVLPTAADSVRSSRWTQLIFIARARHNPSQLPLTLRQAFAGDARLRLVLAEGIDDYTGATTARANHDFVASIFTLFAFLAVALAALGVYAIVAHSVSERRREVAVRVALGATDLGVLQVVLREGNAFALAGIALGLLLTRYGTGWLRAFLWVPEIDPYAIELFIPVALGLFATAVVAALIPAWRATRIDPVEALRCE